MMHSGQSHVRNANSTQRSEKNAPGLRVKLCTQTCGTWNSLR